MIRVEPAASETLYYHRNQQYSVTALTSSTGAIVELYAYTAYGEPKFLSGTGTVLTDSAKDNRYTYTGREWDKAIGLYHYRARMYDSESGRFCGRDPISYSGSPYNVYEYTKSSPLLMLDPTGESYVGCPIALACLGTQGAACSLACMWDPIWDNPADTFSSCVAKCYAAHLEGLGVDIHNTICGAALIACIARTVNDLAIANGPQQLPNPNMPQAPQGPLAPLQRLAIIAN